MILQSYIPPPKPEPATGKKITIPGLGVNVVQVMQMYNRGTLVERARGYYEQEGMEVPDFDRMSHIEKLEALGEYKKASKAKAKELQDKIDLSRKKEEEAILQQTINKKVDDEIKQRSSKDKQGGDAK